MMTGKLLPYLKMWWGCECGLRGDAGDSRAIGRRLDAVFEREGGVVDAERWCLRLGGGRGGTYTMASRTG
jgi:hypothetical protein